MDNDKDKEKSECSENSDDTIITVTTFAIAQIINSEFSNAQATAATLVSGGNIDAEIENKLNINEKDD